MGTSLTGTKPKDTYDSLIKVGDNGPISGTAKYLSDGLGNDLPIAVSTSNVGIGTSAPDTLLHLSSAAGGSILRLERNSVTIAAGESYGQIQWEGQDASSGGPAAGVRASIDAVGDGTLGETYMAFRTSGSLFTSNVERFRITNNGVTFNGDTAVANALSDYEQGTWTMGVSFGGASVGVTTSVNTGTYTKIGRQVTVNGYLILTSKGSSVGDAQITGLPFTIGASNGYYSAASLRLLDISFANQFQGIGLVSSTSVALQEITEAGVGTSITDSDFQDASRVIISFTYFV